MVADELLVVVAVLTTLDCLYGEPMIKLFSREIQPENKTAEIKTAHDILFSCQTEGSPSTIMIRKLNNDTPLNSSRQSGLQSLTYLIHSVRCDHMGIYECTIDNNKTKTTGLMLFDCPPLSCQDDQINSTLFVDMKKNVVFSLCVLAYRKIKNFIRINNSTVKMKAQSSVWTWEYMQINLWTWEYMQINLTTDFINKSTLTIFGKNVTFEDSGDLTIRVYSSADVSYYLDYFVSFRQQGPIQCPTTLTVVDHGLHHILLSWQQGETGKVNNEYFHIFRSTDNSTWSKHDIIFGESLAKITGLLANTDYYFKVVSSGERSTQVNVSFCQQLASGKTESERSQKHEPLSVNVDQRAVNTYVPPAVVVIVAVIITVLLLIRKERRRRWMKVTHESSMETNTSDLCSLENSPPLSH